MSFALASMPELLTKLPRCYHCKRQFLHEEDAASSHCYGCDEYFCDEGVCGDLANPWGNHSPDDHTESDMDDV